MWNAHVLQMYLSPTEALQRNLANTLRSILRLLSDNSLQDVAIELLLSITTLEERLSRYTNITLVFYSLSAYKQNYLDLRAMFSFPSRVIALDEEYATELTRWEEIANEIKHKTNTDHRCIIRMLADFHILPTDQHRLPHRPAPPSHRLRYLLSESTAGGSRFYLAAG